MKNRILFRMLLLMTVAMLSCQHQAQEKKWELIWEDDFDRSDIFSTGVWRNIKKNKYKNYRYE